MLPVYTGCAPLGRFPVRGAMGNPPGACSAGNRWTGSVALPVPYFALVSYLRTSLVGRDR